MPHFTRPAGVDFDGYSSRTGAGLRDVYVPLHEWRDVSLVDGYDSGGRPLPVRPTDATSRACPVGFTEMSPAGGTRRFRFSAVYLGGTVVQVVSLGTPVTVADSVRVTVINPAPVVAHKPLKLGRDGQIPAELQSALREAYDAAWALSKKPGFVEAFRKAVSVLSGEEQRSTIYGETLSRLVFHLLDTSSDKRVQRGLADEQVDVQDQAVAGVAPSYSFRNEPNVWIRERVLRAGTSAVTACIFHEAAHVAGARGDTLAEVALDTVHKAAGIPRVP